MADRPQTLSQTEKSVTIPPPSSRWFWSVKLCHRSKISSIKSRDSFAQNSRSESLGHNLILFLFYFLFLEAVANANIIRSIFKCSYVPSLRVGIISSKSTENFFLVVFAIKRSHSWKHEFALKNLNTSNFVKALSQNCYQGAWFFKNKAKAAIGHS